MHLSPRKLFDTLATNDRTQEVPGFSFSDFKRLCVEYQEAVRRPNAVAKVKQFVRTVSGPKVTRRVFDARMAKCACCPQHRMTAGKHYCGACGCPNWRLAELAHKLWWARLECPLDPPLFRAVDEERERHLLQ
ncbi:MAG: hypothetical protein KAV82_01055 [Phycisphaerae bacterium]|nr:hypothetical protein [Phycisphaerae bacterium]